MPPRATFTSQVAAAGEEVAAVCRSRDHSDSIAGRVDVEAVPAVAGAVDVEAVAAAEEAVTPCEMTMRKQALIKEEKRKEQNKNREKRRKKDTTT